MNAIKYIDGLIKNGRKVAVFSCEDPYNTPFHRDIYNLTSYLHFIVKAGARVVPASLDLALQAKGINAFGVFGHYGVVHGHEVCAAIKALSGDYSSYGPDLKAEIDAIARQYKYQMSLPIKGNVVSWTMLQYELLSRLLPQKQKTLKGTVQGDIIIFCGLVENSHDAKSYKAEILLSSEKNFNAKR